MKGSFNWLKKRVSLVLLPYLFWFFYEHKRMLLDNTDVFFIKLFMGNWNSLQSIIWFLPALFSLNLIVFLFNNGSNFFKSILLVVSFLTFVFSNQISSIHNIIPFGIDVALYMFVLTYFIRFIYENKKIVEKINILWVFIIIPMATFILFYFEPIKTYSHFHSRIDLTQFSVPATVVGYISFIFLSLSIFILFLKIKSNRILAFVGLYSFPIFLIHITILYKLPELLKFDNLILNISFMILTFILSIVIPIGLSKILMRISNKFKYIGLIR